MTVAISPFITARNPDGTYSLTLAQLTSVFIAEIERQLGPRDPNFTFVGLEFDTTPNAKPHIWFLDTGYPGHATDQGSNHIVIRLTADAQNDANLAIWQLARECVHLIDPWNPEAEGRPTNCLEVGLAAWYQNTIIQGIPTGSPFKEAKSLVVPYMPDLAGVVKHLRTEHQVRIGEIDDAELLSRHCPELGLKVAVDLCRRFGHPVNGAE